MLAPSPFSASSSLSILRSAKLSRTPPVGLIRAVCLCEAAGALRAAGARHCQWTESLTLPGSRTQTHAPRSPCYCFHLNPFLLASLPTWVYVHAPSSPSISSVSSCFLPWLFFCPLSSLLSIALHPPSFPPPYPASPSHSLSTLTERGTAASGGNTTQRNRWLLLQWKGRATGWEKWYKSIRIFIFLDIKVERDCIHFKNW